MYFLIASSTTLAHIVVLTDWFAQKNQGDTVIFTTLFITGMNQVRLITDKFVLLQSRSVFYKRAKLTGAQYKHRVIFILHGSHRVIFTLNDRITVGLNTEHIQILSGRKLFAC